MTSELAHRHLQFNANKLLVPYALRFTRTTLSSVPKRVDLKCKESSSNNGE